MSKQLIIVLLVFIGLGLSLFNRLIHLEVTDQHQLFERVDRRSTVTFLLGDDKEGQSYFALAERHFLLDSAEKTDKVVKSCKTLTAVLSYLENHGSSTPWGVINVVVHGNMWGGLSVPMWPEGGRAFPKELYAASRNGDFPRLSDKVVDSLSKVNFWACGIGKNPLINLALEDIFTNAAGVTADVYVSPHFVIFHESALSATPVRIKASYWPYFFKRGYRPSELEIAQELATQFPEEKINWHQGLQNTFDGAANAEFQDEFNVPVVWTVLYDTKDSRPDISTEDLKMKWISEQPDLMQKIEDLEIPVQKYHWTVNKIIYRHSDGTTQAAIKAIGMCTVLCVLSPISV